MQYDLSRPLDRERYEARCRSLVKKGAVVEMTEHVFKTPNQNRYLHLLIGVVALDTGNTIEDAKVAYYKKMVNPDLFLRIRQDKLGNSIESVRSITELTKEEVSISIDRFKRWGYENGIYMPNPEDTALLQDIELEIGRNRAYL